MGPSGSGTSSLIQAGVLPALTAGEVAGSDRWLAVRVRPGQDLCAEVECARLPGATVEQARTYREELMKERKFFVDEHNEPLYEREFSLCEH
ncbi:hypothetical protein [Streptomyces sp. NPDC057686]|uniref:nSTAND1 domain-containing NTPase n=1 Tax=Streptomyces sp. NPDC057686 TaxID=3346212 RepID=UPI0036C4CC9B